MLRAKEIFPRDILSTRTVGSAALAQVLQSNTQRKILLLRLTRPGREADPWLEIYVELYLNPAVYLNWLGA